MNKFYYKKGYTLVESLIYIAVFVLMSFLIINLILFILETNKKVAPFNALTRNTVSVFEIITKEIRAAKSIDTANSVFNDPNGVLKIIGQNIDGSQKLVDFYLDAGAVRVISDNIDLGPLTASKVVVNSLTFILATSSKQDLIKIELDLTAGEGKYQKSSKYYSSVGLRIDN